MDNFLSPAIGGALIGIAAILLLATLGRIAGISGIVWGAIAGPQRGWRWLFLLGLMAGGALAHFATGLPIPETPATHPGLAVLGGLLVGIGTRMGSGCTSGHGVCGIGRLSPRSIVATVTFMASGVVTVYVMRHIVEASL